MTEGELQNHWRSQDVAAPQISIDYLAYRARELQKVSRRENFVAQLAFVLGIGVFGWMSVFVAHSILGRMALGGFVAYGIYAAYVWRREFPAVNARDFDSGREALVFYRGQLERKRDYARWSWTRVAPMHALMALLLFVQWTEMSKVKGLVIPEAIFIVVITIVAYFDTSKKRKRLQAEVDALATLGVPRT